VQLQHAGQPHYSDLAITTALTLRAVFHLPLRQTEGLIGSVLQLLSLDLPVPDYSTLSRRAQSPELPAQPRATGEPIHLLVDSSGLKLSGPGEWLVEKHGTSRRRSWRKLHIGFDAVTGRIVASILTDRDVDDASQVGPLLDQIAEPVEVFMGTAAMTEPGVQWDERHPAAVVNRRQDGAPWRHEERVPGSAQRHCCLQSMVEHFSCWAGPVKPEAAVGGGP
jgi:hypothetical protein